MGTRETISEMTWKLFLLKEPGFTWVLMLNQQMINTYSLDGQLLTDFHGIG